MLGKFIENWKKNKAIRRRQKDVRKAREYIYNVGMRKQYLVSDVPTYHFSKYDPTRYWTRTWYNPETKIKIIRARFVRADVVEVFYEDSLQANWADQSYQLGSNDFSTYDFTCTEAFSEALVKG